MRIPRIYCLLFLIGLAILNISCAPYWRKPFTTYIYPKGCKEGTKPGESIYLGMTKEKVISCVGKPDTISKNYDTEVWFYNRLAESNSKYKLTFIGDELESIDEFVLEGFF